MSMAAARENACGLSSTNMALSSGALSSASAGRFFWGTVGLFNSVSEKKMLHIEYFRSPDLQRRLFHAMFAAAFAAPLFLGPAPVIAEAKLTSAQQQTMVQCLIGCNKSDASCQNNCTKQSSTPAYFSAAGSCVRACADALAVPEQQQSQAGDLMKCVQACN
jgi:hypothetical protein